MIRECDDHGYFAARRCPACDDGGREVLDEDRRVRISKFLSGALRHFPDDVALSLDDRGWTEYDSLVDAATTRYDSAEPAHVEAVIATDSKGRFERQGGRVRAAYGHSVDVDLESTEGDVPDRLFHGTAPRNLEAIVAEGLRPMDRRQVHLAATAEAARAVGERHAADPVVVAIDAAAMVRDGFDVDARGAATYTVDRVPPAYIEDERESDAPPR